MGAYESRHQHPAEEAESLEDYYALLEVSEDATQDEIKKVRRSSSILLQLTGSLLPPEVIQKTCFEASPR